MIALINCFLINHQVRKWNEFYVALLLETLVATPLCVSWSWIRPGSFQGNLQGAALFKLTSCSSPKAPLSWNTTSFSLGPVLAKSTFSLQVYHSEFPSGIFKFCLMFSSIHHNHFGPTTLDPDGLMFTSTYSVSPGAYMSIVATFPPFFLKVRSLPGQFLCNKIQVSESIQRRKTPKKKSPTFSLTGMCFPRDTGIKFITGNTSINYLVYELTV